jgi:5'-3' exonuclease
MALITPININIVATKPVILIDQSYYIFNRYYATYNWYRRKTDEELDFENINENSEFILAFFRHFENDMKKLLKKYKTVKSNVIFCIDCCRCDIWRNELYPDYKMSRSKKTNFNSIVFILFKNYISNYDFNYCEYNNLEADDVVYLIQKKIKDEFKDLQIIIITNDNDYLQMYDTNINIYNMQFKDLSLRIKNNPVIELEFKIIYGDKSDNIQKIQMGLNKNNAFKLAIMNYDDKLKYLLDNKILDNYKLNKKLVDLSQIPENLMISFNNKYNIISIKK